MNQELKRISDADLLFYYHFSEEESCAITLNFILRTAIDQAALKRALHETLKRYPNFRETPVLDQDGYLTVRENDREADVYPYDPDPAEFGTYETNGYLFKVSHLGKRLWISAFHGICDGRGLMMFARSLLFHYFTLKGRKAIHTDGLILTEKVPADPSEMADPFTFHSEINASASPAFRRKEDNDVFWLPEEVSPVDRCAFHRRFQFILDQEKLLGLAHEAETTLEAFFNLTVARAIHEFYDTKDRVIMQLGAVDLRPFYHSRYLKNLRELYWVPFIEPLFHVPDQIAAMMTRKVLMNLQLQKSHFDGINYQNRSMYKDTLNFPLSDTEALKELRKQTWRALSSVATFFTTNLGRMDLGSDLDRFVERADIYAPCIFGCPCFFLLSQGKETAVNLVQRHYDKHFALRLLGIFRELGVLIQYNDSGRFESDRLHIRGLERERIRL